MFRANDLNGKEVKGYWCVVEGKHYMILEDAELYPENEYHLEPLADYVEIDPKTLAMDTTVKDKHSKLIFGSFPVDVVMSNGGDRTKSVDGTIYTIEWEWGGLGFVGRSKSGIVQLSDLVSLTKFDIEIIGPACDVGDK